jgi:hypothetical protein
MSGQIPLDPKTMELVEGFEAQTVQVFENLKAVAEAAGGSFKDIVKLNIFLTDLSHFAKVNESWAVTSNSPTLPAPPSAWPRCQKAPRLKWTPFWSSSNAPVTGTAPVTALLPQGSPHAPSIASGLAALLLGGCASHKPEDFNGTWINQDAIDAASKAAVCVSR